MADKSAATRFETAVVDFLVAHGLSAVKPRQTKWYDVGDIWLGNDVILQAKFYTNFASALRDGVTGAQLQAERARRPYGFAVIKRPGKSIGDAYVAMPLKDLVKLLQR